MRSTRVLVLLAVPFLIGSSCEDTVTAPFVIPAGVEIFTATLNGPNERPTPVTSTATATAVITVIGNLVSWKVIVSDIDSLTVGHIHKGVADSAGGVILNLAPTGTGLDFSGTVAQGSAVVHDSVLVLMRAQRAYVNLHTRLNTGGEIRGQTIQQ